MIQSFDELFIQTAELVAIQDSTISIHLSKLMEESGEFAQALNKFIGTKGWDPVDTTESIKQEVLEEAADQVQIILGIVSKLNFTSEDFLLALKKKNKKYKKKIKQIPNDETILFRKNVQGHI